MLQRVIYWCSSPLLLKNILLSHGAYQSLHLLKAMVYVKLFLTRNNDAGKALLIQWTIYPFNSETKSSHPLLVNQWHNWHLSHLQSSFSQQQHHINRLHQPSTSHKNCNAIAYITFLKRSSLLNNSSKTGSLVNTHKILFYMTHQQKRFCTGVYGTDRLGVLYIILLFCWCLHATSFLENEERRPLKIMLACNVRRRRLVDRPTQKKMIMISSKKPNKEGCSQ